MFSNIISSYTTCHKNMVLDSHILVLYISDLRVLLVAEDLPMHAANVNALELEVIQSQPIRPG